jgi:hypothetical protein
MGGALNDEQNRQNGKWTKSSKFTMKSIINQIVFIDLSDTFETRISLNDQSIVMDTAQ